VSRAGEGDGVGLGFEVIGYTSSRSSNSRCSYPIALVPLTVLKPHEQDIPERVEALMRSLVEDGVQIKPILVDSKTLVILDGHHRVEALKRMGARYVAAVIVDYDDDECIAVGSWREGWNVTKELVRRTGVEGKRLPPRTSRHMPRFEVPEVRVPIERLLGGERGGYR
jgi:hypothetical protein